MNDSKFNRLYEWLFNDEERAPIGFIPTLFMCIVVSTMVGLFVIPVIHHLMK